jgi:hypothetical protein
MDQIEGSSTNPESDFDDSSDSDEESFDEGSLQ